MKDGAQYRVVLSTGGVHEASVKCKSLSPAKRFAREWAGDVGVEGWINLESKQQGVWVHVATARVRNSEVTGWEAP